MRIGACDFFSERDFVVARVLVNRQAGNSGDVCNIVVFRISGNSCAVALVSRAVLRSFCPLTPTRTADGHCSAVISGRSVLLCDRGRVCTRTGVGGSAFVDAVTGAVLQRAAINNVEVDTSGALMWRGGGLMTSSGLDSGGCALANVKKVTFIYSFRYGVCVTRSGDECHVLRFDDERYSGREVHG